MGGGAGGKRRPLFQKNRTDCIRIEGENQRPAPVFEVKYFVHGCGRQTSNPRNTVADGDDGALLSQSQTETVPLQPLRESSSSASPFRHHDILRSRRISVLPEGWRATPRDQGLCATPP